MQSINVNDNHKRLRRLHPDVQNHPKILVAHQYHRPSISVSRLQVQIPSPSESRTPETSELPRYREIQR